MQNKTLIQLIEQEGFEIVGGKVHAWGKEFPLVHPFAIYGKLYREEKDPKIKLKHMIRLHHMMWPDDIATWHYWTERRFQYYCEGWRITSWASGANTGKSVDAAKIAAIEWASNPKRTGIIVASTTLDSLNSRIYGYLVGNLKNSAIPIQYNLMRSQPPKVMYDRDDMIHTISAIAAAKGSAEAENSIGGKKSGIRNYIGRHPKDKLLLILDEATDLDPTILGAIPNLDSGECAFQCIAIGNSCDRSDLHGALSTPKVGWGKIDPEQNTVWETNQRGGLCLYFNCDESPAIHETDLEKKKKLSKFLFTAESIKVKRDEYGKDSNEFWRFVKGFWPKEESVNRSVVSGLFLKEFNVERNAEWSGLKDLKVVAGLDPAFSVGGDKCILRLAILGQDIQGRMILDFRGEEMVYKININATMGKSAELQIADQVLDVLGRYNCTLGAMAVDATGHGRSLAEVIRLRAQAIEMPIKIYTMATAKKNKNAFDVQVVSSYELWMRVKDFIQHDQVRGLDYNTINQLTSRLIVVRNGKPELEPKAEYKMRMMAISPSLAHSPDEADAAALCVQAACIKHGFTPGQVAAKMMAGYSDMALEKYWAYLHGKKIEQEEADTRPREVPVASFSGDIYDSGGASLWSRSNLSKN